MTREELERRLTDAYSFGRGEMEAVMRELGADHDVAGEVSKQGGGGDRINWRWPNGLHFDIKYGHTVESAFELLDGWQCWCNLWMPPRAYKAARIFCVKVGRNVEGKPVGEGESRSEAAAIWLAAIRAELRPHGLTT